MSEIETKLKFNIDCEMNLEEAIAFISMLKEMELLGRLGASRTVGLKIDGDGNFKPKFKFNTKLIEHAPVIKPDMSILRKHDIYIYDPEKLYKVDETTKSFIENSCKCDVFPGEGISRS